MIEKCAFCQRLPINNEDIFFDVSTSPTGKDDISTKLQRIDAVVCVNCIPEWIRLNGFETINLIRRIENPYPESIRTK